MNSITEILDELRIPYSHSGDHRNVREGFVGIDCPWCGHENGKRHLGISIEDGFGTCWQCSYHSLASILHTISGLPYDRIRALLDGLPQTRLRKKQVHRGHLRLPDGHSYINGAHYRYLRGRGFDALKVVGLWHLGGFTLHPQYNWRLFIPIHYRGEVVSWTTRSTGRVESGKYKSATPEQSVIPIKELLYGEDHARHSVVVCEGVTGVWRIGPGAVALFGMAATIQQVKKLSQFSLRVICFDNEPEAQRRADKLAELLAPYPGKTERVCLKSPDPGGATADEVAEIRANWLS
ncbi:hypothetical protein LCGC14_0249830 [marine sediment metagenome]|uniref:Toprim domain-containing protein n=1 Tax=marine sediment metagenome TaxID=412755 RepID=A0A0F9U5B1_9ZZZZ